MCMFAEPVPRVSDTRIFVSVRNGRQVVVYEMSIHLRAQTGRGNAMILPVPVGAGGAEAVQLVDLSSAPHFFDPLADLFVQRSRSMSLSKGDDDDFVPVVRVGSYDVSVVPSVADIRRVNPDVFVLSSKTEAVLQQFYPVGYAFVVAQLRESGAFHPLAYVHPQVEGHLFVPTRHEHGDVDNVIPDWDHEIYVLGPWTMAERPQADRNFAFMRAANIPEGWHEDVSSYLMSTAPAVAPFLAEGAPLLRIKAEGPLPNMDIVMRPA